MGAQRLAFQKLLKKYRKWTGSPVLGRRIQRDVLGRPSTFSQDYFETLLEEWTDVLIAVRAPFKVNTSGSANGAAFAPAVAERGDSTKAGELAEEYREAESFPPCAAHLHELADRGTDVELDTALATSRLGHPAGRACYWVHPDNVVELQVLLLQYTRLRNVSNSRSCSSSSTSHRPSRRTAVNSQGISSFSAVEDETSHFILDDLVTFSKNQSAANINDAENAAGKRLGKAAVGIRYCTSGEAIIVIGTSPEPPNLESPTGNLTVLKAKVKRKHLQSLFDCSTSKLPPQRSVDEVTQATTHQSPDPTQELDNVRKWLAGHPTVRPLVELQYRRTRFVGLGNNTTRGLWASLDREITMRKAINHFGSSEGQPSPNEGKGGLADDVSFPYVLLHIRWEGDSGADLVRALDQTHLVSYRAERITIHH